MRERWRGRGKGRGNGSGRKTKIVPGLGLLTDAGPSVIVFRALFHCLVATVIVFYCMGVRRGERGKEGGRRRGNCAGNAMLESVLTRRSLRHFIKSGHGAVQFSTHFLCTASRATSFPSFRYFLSSFPRYLVRHLSSVSLLSLSKSIVLLLSQCHPQLAKVLSSGTYNFWHLGINFSSYRGMNRRARGEVTFSKMTTKCSERRLQKLSASALGYCNNFPDTQRGK